MPIKSYVKVYGPPLMRAIEALEAVEVDTEEIPARAVGAALAEYDFCFEWDRGQPDPPQFHRLIEEIEEALAPLGVWYTIQTFVRI
jgi:hypothetical protein